MRSSSGLPAGLQLSATMSRRGVALLAVTVACLAAMTFGAAPAHAAAPGHFLSKGPGTLYSPSESQWLGAAPGGTPATFFHKVVNEGSSLQQFKVVVLTQDDAFDYTLFYGSAPQPDPYYTPAIPPGGSLVLSLRVTAPPGSLPAIAHLTILLMDPETNTTVDLVFDSVSFTDQTGTTRNDAFIKSGAQPYVGGYMPANGLIAGAEMSNVIKPGQSAQFLLRLQNNGTTPAQIHLAMRPNTGNCPAINLTVKRGLTDVTTAVTAGTYSTPALAPGAKQGLTLVVKLPSTASCTSKEFNAWVFTASGPDGAEEVGAVVNLAA